MLTSLIIIVTWPIRTLLPDRTNMTNKRVSPPSSPILKTWFIKRKRKKVGEHHGTQFVGPLVFTDMWLLSLDAGVFAVSTIIKHLAAQAYHWSICVHHYNINSFWGDFVLAGHELRQLCKSLLIHARRDWADLADADVSTRIVRASHSHLRSGLHIGHDILVRLLQARGAKRWKLQPELPVVCCRLGHVCEKSNDRHR